MQLSYHTEDQFSSCVSKLVSVIWTQSLGLTAGGHWRQQYEDIDAEPGVLDTEMMDESDDDNVAIVPRPSSSAQHNSNNQNWMQNCRLSENDQSSFWCLAFLLSDQCGSSSQRVLCWVSATVFDILITMNAMDWEFNKRLTIKGYFYQKRQDKWSYMRWYRRCWEH